MGFVQTVRGPVNPAALGRVLMHEHVQSLQPGPWLSGGRDDDPVGMAVQALSHLRELGFGTVVDLTSYGIAARDVPRLRDISVAADVHIVAASAVYVEQVAPQWTRDASVEEIAAVFIRDATEGVDGSGVRIGILGEQATGINSISPHEEKCLRAAGRASIQAGLSLCTHTGHGTMALEQIRILREEGVDLTRVVIGHMDQAPASAVRAALASGVTVGFDTLGKELWDVGPPVDPRTLTQGEFVKQAYYLPDAARLATLADLVSSGFAGQIVLSLDLTGREVYLNGATHGQHGYSFLGNVVVPRLEALGVPRHAIDAMLRDNPARLLTALD